MSTIRTLIGYVEITREDLHECNYLEVAEWWCDHHITPGEYPVHVTFDVMDYETGRLCPRDVMVLYDSVVRNEYLTPLFAGVPIGVTRKDNVGKVSRIGRRLYAYEFPAQLADDGPGPVEWLDGVFTPLSGMSFEPAMSVDGQRRYGTNIVVPDDAQYEAAGGRETGYAYAPYTPKFQRPAVDE